VRISHRHRFVFIAIPKNASTSIRAALGPHSDVLSGDRDPYYHHVSASALRDHFAEREWDWDGYFKFAVVRNPWERVVSQYRYLRHMREFGLSGVARRDFDTWCRRSPECYARLRRGLPSVPGRLWASVARPYNLVRRLGRLPSRRRMLRQLPNEAFLRHLEQVWRPQLSWIADPDGLLLVDAVLRAESVGEEWPGIMARLGLPEEPLPRLSPDRRPIAGESPDHRGFFSPDTARIVADRFAPDIARFGYSFAPDGEG
jgi:hypothetical protein